MANTPLQKVRLDALELPAQQRPELAHDLLTSLDGPAYPGAAAAWDGEIVRRAEALESGLESVLNRAEFSGRMRERLSRL